MLAIELIDVKKYFPLRGRDKDGEKRIVRALDGVSLSIEKGKIHAIIGETGSGKTTVARIITGLTEPTSGSVKIDGKPLFSASGKINLEVRKSIQMVFQDPYSSFNPKFTIARSVSEPLRLHHIKFDMETISSALERVNLTPPGDFLARLPHELSGGQKQRAAFARAIIINPSIIVADEPVSMLDASIRANVLKLIRELNGNSSTTFILISHDISMALMISDSLTVIYLGKIKEQGTRDQIRNNPLHPYSQLLFETVPTLDSGNIPDVTYADIDASIRVHGCSFADRCKFAKSICFETDPELKEIEQGHLVACHLY
jgi:peptide/nickel transport system ATP-binding protein